MDYIKIGVYGKRCLMCRFLRIGGKDKPYPQGGGLDVGPKPTEDGEGKLSDCLVVVDVILRFTGYVLIVGSRIVRPFSSMVRKSVI